MASIEVNIHNNSSNIKGRYHCKIEYIRILSLKPPNTLHSDEYDSIGYYQKINSYKNIYKHLKQPYYLYYQNRLGWIVTKQLLLDKPNIVYLASTRNFFEPVDSKLTWINIKKTKMKNPIRLDYVVDLPDNYIPPTVFPDLLEIIREPSSTRLTYPGKVTKLLGIYCKTDITRSGCPVYQHESSMAFLFYCTYYNQNDWRVSQSLPHQNSRSPARIRCSCPKGISPLNPFLFWEIVDQDDIWESNQQGVVLRWYYKNNKQEHVCSSVLGELGLNDDICKGWLSDNYENKYKPIGSNLNILSTFRKYYKKHKFPTLTGAKITKKFSIIYPLYITVGLVTFNVPGKVQEVQGLYKKTNRLLYGAPVYKQVDSEEINYRSDSALSDDDDSGSNQSDNETNDNVWLFFCKKYANHDWRISKQLPKEGDRAPALVRAYSKYVCSPVEDGLFWEAINESNRWNTHVDAFKVTYYNEDPNKESVLYSVLSMLGIPVRDCIGWLSDNPDQTLNGLNNSYTALSNYINHCGIVNTQ